MSSAPPVVLYRYNASPYSIKVDHILLLKNIPHNTVHVNFTLPRPEISELLGIPYRRIPILAIGNDVYCDTSLICSALERRFPPSEGYGTIFPPRKRGGSSDTGLIKAFSKHYADDALFPLAPALLQWENFPPSFIKDRGSFYGNPLDVKGLVASRGKSISLLSAHLALVEEQLSDGRHWLFDTELPSLADVSVHFVYSWILSFRSTEPLFDAKEFPLALQWVTRLTNFLETKKAGRSAVPNNITGTDAANLITSSTFESYNVVGFDSYQATKLGVRLGDTVAIAPNDTGRTHPTVGKLVGLNQEEFVIETQVSSSSLRCHFPRIGFTVKRQSHVETKL